MLYRALFFCFSCLFLLGANGLEAAGFVCADFLVGPLEDGAARAAKPAQGRRAGRPQAIVLFAQFRGEQPGSRHAPAWSADIFNRQKPGSFAHFYDTMSFGRLQVEGRVASKRYESAQVDQAYLAANTNELGRFGQFSLEILQQADVDIDFADFDNDGPDGVADSGDDDGLVDIVFIVTASAPRNFLVGNSTGKGELGLGEDFVTDDLGANGQPMRIRGTQGTIQLGRTYAETVGVMCHEYGHLLGLWDLFNTDYLRTPNGPPEEDSAGIGRWGLMGWGATGWHGDDGPNSFSAWSRMQLGWTQRLEVTQAQQEIQLQEVGSGGALYQIPLRAQEFFLLEYRRRDQYYDRHIPAEGVLIWHVNWVPPQEDRGGRYVVDLESADGRWQDAGFPQGRLADPGGGGDNLDFWAHDEGYARRHSGNLGDGTDVFDGIRFTEFTPATNPASYSSDGGVSASVEGIRLVGGKAVARVSIAPLKVGIEALQFLDEDGDGVFMAGEEITLQFRVANQGGLAATNVQVRLRGNDPALNMNRTETHFGDLPLGSRTQGRGTGFPALRFIDNFAGIHTAALSLELYANGRLEGVEDFEIPGVSPRQIVRQMAVIDSLGNGDGRADPGEFIRLHLRLDRAAPAQVRSLRFTLGSLDKRARPIGAPGVSFAAETLSLTSRHSPEFLLVAGAGGAGPMAFEWAVDTGFGRWKDTLTVVLHPGLDRVPPRVGLGTLAANASGRGVGIVLPRNQILDGSPITRVEAMIYNRDDTSQVAAVPLAPAADDYQGLWTGATPGRYWLEGTAEDASGNIGRSGLQPLEVFGDGLGAEGRLGLSRGWTEVPLPGALQRPVIGSLVVAPSQPEFLYARSQHSVWRSTDGGRTWVRLGLMVAGSFLSALQQGQPYIFVDPQNPFAVYLNEQPYNPLSALKSRDGGWHWQALGAGANVALLAVDPLGSGRLYGSDGKKLLVSEDGGERWRVVGVEDSRAVHIHPGDRDIVYARVAFDALAHSADGGQTWERRHLGQEVNMLAVDPHHTAGLYAAGDDTLWYSADFGSSWSGISAVPVRGGRWSYEFAAHSTQADGLFLWERRTSINPSPSSWWRSWDRGQTWEEQSLPPWAASLHMWSIVFHPQVPQRHFLLTLNDFNATAVLRTDDDGQMWETLRLPQVRQAVGPMVVDQSGRVYAGASRRDERGQTQLGFYLNEGAGWQWRGVDQSDLSGATIPWTDFPVVEALYRNEADPDIIVASVFPYNIFGEGTMIRSLDSGQTWRQAKIVWLQRAFVNSSYPEIQAHPQVSGVLYFGPGADFESGDSFWRSPDFGATWEKGRLPADLGGSELPLRSRANSLIVDPLQPDHLYVGLGQQLWHSPDEGANWQEVGRVGSGGAVLALAIPARKPQNLYAVILGGLFVSLDRGANWRLLFKPALDGRAKIRLRFDPKNPDNFYLVTGPRLYETRDGGKVWRSIGEGLQGRPWFTDVAVDPTDPALVYAATPWGLYHWDQEAGETASVSTSQVEPFVFVLQQNFPNPFNHSTRIPFALAEPQQLELAVFNLAGQRIATLVKGMYKAGAYEVDWDARDDKNREAASGIYLCRLRGDKGLVETRKLVLLR